MYMANVRPNARGPNATYIPPASIGLVLGPWALTLGLLAFMLGMQGFGLGPQENYPRDNFVEINYPLDQLLLGQLHTRIGTGVGI